MPGTGPLGRSRLVDRRRECGALDRLLGAVHEGGSGVLVLRGEAGIGKTALLGHRDARELPEAVTPRGLDARVRDRIVAETRGNPLALLELPRGLEPAELSAGFGLPDMPAVPHRIEESFVRRVERLPATTRQLLLAAAVEPTGEP